MPDDEISRITYKNSGVDLIAARGTAARMKKKFADEGIDMKGHFGGAIDLAGYKFKSSVPIGVDGTPIAEDKNSFETGKKTAWLALRNRVRDNRHLLAMLDYYASESMGDDLFEFFKGVLMQGIESHVPLIGGESAQMTGTYQKKGEKHARDAYVDVIYAGRPEVGGPVIDIARFIKGMEHPMLCGSTDGTGTKTKVMKRKSPLDIIYHGCNDVGAVGARPVGFKLYVAGNVEDRVLFDVADWAKIACENSGIGYLGATVVPKPEAYVEGEIDIAGTVVGVIDKKNLITGERIEEGDVIVGISTDCLMTNGLSMARRLTEAINRKHGWDYDTPVEALGGKSQRDEILKPHTFYTDIMFGAWGVPGVYSHFGESIRGTAHITGDGQPGNINRMIPDGLCAVVEKEVLPIPPLMRFYMDEGANVEEMWETFNMGVGMSFIMPESAANQFIKHVEYNFQHGNEHTERKAKIIGRIEKSPDGKKYRWAA